MGQQILTEVPQGRLWRDTIPYSYKGSSDVIGLLETLDGRV
jgi:hypothetical protein